MTDDLATRLRRVRLVVSDVDGVLTDGTVLVLPDGSEACRYSRHDGRGVELLREMGVDVAWTSNDSETHLARATKLGVDVWDGRRMQGAMPLQRRDLLKTVNRVPVDAVCYIGDADTDVEALRWVAQHGGVALFPREAALLFEGSVLEHCDDFSDCGLDGFRFSDDDEDEMPVFELNALGGCGVLLEVAQLIAAAREAKL